jgi:hypothetical protein
MNPAVDARLVEIGLDECLRLLTDHHLGRVAITVGSQPVVFPVNYTMADAEVVFRTGPGSQLHAAAGRRVAFEIDSADAQYHDGWSVVVQGVAAEERDADRLAALAKLPLTPWVSGAREHWMCIKEGVVTGRRISHVATNE